MKSSIKNEYDIKEEAKLVVRISDLKLDIRELAEISKKVKSMEEDMVEIFDVFSKLGINSKPELIKHRISNFFGNDFKKNIYLGDEIKQDLPKEFIKRVKTSHQLKSQPEKKIPFRERIASVLNINIGLLKLRKKSHF